MKIARAAERDLVMPTVTVIQHTPAEGLGLIAPLLRQRGVDVDLVRPDEPLPAGARRRADGLIVLGGPMGTSVTRSDEYRRVPRLSQPRARRPQEVADWRPPPYIKGKPRLEGVPPRSTRRMATWRPEAIIFDVNETLFDLEPLGTRFEEAGLPGLALDLWLARVLRDGFAHAAAGTFAAFPDLAAFHLGQLLEGRAEQPEVHVQRILDALRTVAPFPDVEPGLMRLRDAGVRMATLTNGTVELTSRWLDQSGLRSYFVQVLDVSAPMLWKPRREPYVHAAQQLGVEIERCALISVHPWDVHGATGAGMMAAWLDRQGRTYPEVMNPPTTRARTMDELARRLLDRPRW